MKIFCLIVCVVLCGAHAVFGAKGGGGGKDAVPATPPRTLVSVTTKPEIKLPLSPNSTNVAAQLREIFQANDRLKAPRALGVLQIEMKTHVLAPKPLEIYDLNEVGERIDQTEYDWGKVRAIGDRFWLLSRRSILVSAPGNPSKWDTVHHFPIKENLIDVFSLNGATYLLASDWLAEMSVDGKSMLRVVYLAPRDMVVRRNLNYLGGKSVSRTDPMNFRKVTVWKDTAWIGNGSDAWFKFNQTLVPVELRNFGGSFHLLPMEDELLAFGKPLVGLEPAVVLRTKDGVVWSKRSKIVTGDAREFAAGNGRMVKVMASTFQLSADGLVWGYCDTQPMPEVIAEFAEKDGSIKRQSRSGFWHNVTFADGLFAAVGAQYQEGKRYAYNDQKPDLPVFGLSFDGVHWRTWPLSLKNDIKTGLLVMGSKGRFVVTATKRSSEVLEVAVSGMPPQSESHPSFTKVQELSAALELALIQRDGRSALMKVAEWETYFPSEKSSQQAAFIRAQAGDVDGAWNRLEALSIQMAGNLETEALRPFILLAARRAQEGQAYAAWLLYANAKEFNQPKATSGIRMARSKLLAMTGQLADAVAVAETLADQEPKNIEVRNLLAGLYQQRGNLVTAKRWLKEAADLGDLSARKMLEAPEFK